MLRQLLRVILFDNSCSLCNKRLKEKAYICEVCKIKLENMCYIKKRENLYYLCYYTDIKNILLDFKFKNRKGIAQEFKFCVSDSIKKIVADEDIDVIISVPISKERLLKRGYNQVDEILESSLIKFDKIKRIKNTKFMYQIEGDKKRAENIRGAFLVEKNYKNKNILIVDDVVTTGSTLREIESELIKNYKPKKVIFFTLAIVREYFRR